MGLVTKSYFVTQVQAKLYFATPVHTSGSLGIAGGMHTPQRVSGSRYEIVFRNVIAGEVVLRAP